MKHFPAILILPMVSQSMLIGIEHHLAILARGVLRSWCSRYVTVFGQTRLIEALRSLNNFIQARCNLRWGHATTEDILRRYYRTVEITVGIFAFDEGRAFE
jgi:hypothetical protein